MPRLTDARRELRQDQILRAAMTCFLRNGMERTSIADITAESGLSPGSIYAHFRGKADIVRATAQSLLTRRFAELTALAEAPAPPGPDELLELMAAAIDPDEARIGLQAWGEATTDPDMRDIVLAMTGRMRELIQTVCTAWLTRAGRDPAEAPALARRLMAAYQGLLAERALTP